MTKLINSLVYNLENIQTGLIPIYTLKNIYIFYVSCIRPHLEYACQLWDPYTSESINILEGVQKFACRVCLGHSCSDYEAMLHRLDIPTLLTHRRYLKITTMFNIMYRILHPCECDIRYTRTEPEGRRPKGVVRV